MLYNSAQTPFLQADLINFQVDKLKLMSKMDVVPTPCLGSFICIIICNIMLLSVLVTQQLKSPIDDVKFWLLLYI